jgi:hypothetical protein
MGILGLPAVLKQLGEEVKLSEAGLEGRVVGVDLMVVLHAALPHDGLTPPSTDLQGQRGQLGQQGQQQLGEGQLGQRGLEQLGRRGGCPTLPAPTHDHSGCRWSLAVRAAAARAVPAV